MKGDKAKEIAELLATSNEFKKAYDGITSQVGKKKFAYDFLRFWKWVQAEAKLRFEWLKDVSKPGDLITHFDKAQDKERYWHIDLIGEWLQSQRISSVTKQTIADQLRRFYVKNRSPLPKEALKFEASALEMERATSMTAINTIELHSLIMRGNTLERAVLLCCFQGALGISEFDLFNKKGYTEEFAKRLDTEQIPLKIKLIRKKTYHAGAKPYYTFLHQDAVSYLRKWLKDRERLTGKPIRHDESIFITKNKKTGQFAPVEKWTVERIMRTLSQEVGLEKHEKFDPHKYTHVAQIRHKFHPHELRDLFKSQCTRAGVVPIASEFFMGHDIDRLNYDKSPELYEDFYRDQYNKLGKYINLISASGAPEEIKEQTSRMIVLEDRIRELEKTLEEMEKDAGFNDGYKFTQMMEPNLTEGIYEICTAKDEKELDALLAQGFELAMQLPDGKWKMKKKKSENKQ
jgi:hypothetical protein